MTILAIDPGKTTGFSSSLGLAWELDLEHRELYDHLRDFHTVQHKIVNLVCEAFLYRPNQATQYIAAELIGVVKEFSRRYEVHLTMQNPSDKKRWADKDIKKLGLWLPGKGHAMDAVRHRLQFQARNNQFDWNLLKD